MSHMSDLHIRTCRDNDVIDEVRAICDIPDHCGGCDLQACTGRGNYPGADGTCRRFMIITDQPERGHVLGRCAITEPWPMVVVEFELDADGNGVDFRRVWGSTHCVPYMTAHLARIWDARKNDPAI